MKEEKMARMLFYGVTLKHGVCVHASFLHQVVMCLPSEDADTHKESAGLCREEALSLYNTLLLQLHQSQPTSIPLTLHGIG